MQERVLLIEDDPGYRALLKLRLERIGLKVETAANGEEGMLAFQRAPAEVVLTDLMMPRVDGMTVLKLVKGIRPETKIIMITGKGTIERAVEAMKAGAFDFVVKPVEEGRLEQLVRHCLSCRGREGADGEEGPIAEKEKRAATLAKSHLTPQEIRIVQLVLQGNSDKEIAGRLFISYHTVKKHLQNAFRKLDVQSRVELIVKLR